MNSFPQWYSDRCWIHFLCDKLIDVEFIFSVIYRSMLNSFSRLYTDRCWIQFCAYFWTSHSLKPKFWQNRLEMVDIVKFFQVPDGNSNSLYIIICYQIPSTTTEISCSSVISNVFFAILQMLNGYLNIFQFLLYKTIVALWYINTPTLWHC